MINKRNYSLFDNLVMHIDNALKILTGNIAPTKRKNPAEEVAESALSVEQQKHIVGLMRVNYAGEVSAQALYQGQAFVARSPHQRDKLLQLAEEENEHLAWCSERINQLKGRTSYLDPYWYLGSFCIGALAGLTNDALSMGFLAETEYQVIKHLDNHLNQISKVDKKSSAIIQQMRSDEAKHAMTALDYGAAELPIPIKKIMGLMSKVMTKTAYWI